MDLDAVWDDEWVGREMGVLDRGGRVGQGQHFSWYRVRSGIWRVGLSMVKKNLRPVNSDALSRPNTDPPWIVKRSRFTRLRLKSHPEGH